MPLLRVASYNIYNTTGRYEQGRRELLKETINALDVHILGLQEVVFGLGGQTEMLQAEWSAFLAPLQQPQLSDRDATFRIDGNALLLPRRQDPEVSVVVAGAAETLVLSPLRTAQRLPLRVTCPCGSAELTVVNTHLHWSATGIMCDQDDAAIREGQMRAVLEWIEAIPGSTLLLGDLNMFFPDEKVIDLAKSRGFVDVFEDLHGSHPVTCPTPLQAPTILPEESVQQPADYILIRQRGGALRFLPRSATLAGNQPSAVDPTLYPSDHFAVRAVFELVTNCPPSS